MSGRVFMPETVFTTVRTTSDGICDSFRKKRRVEFFATRVERRGNVPTGRYFRLTLFSRCERQEYVPRDEKRFRGVCVCTFAGRPRHHGKCLKL